jgi:hypothetical protein
MKKTQVDHQPALAPVPTAKAILTQVASKLRGAGASVPVPVEASAPTIEGSMKSGLSIALCLVETELDTLAAAAPRDNPAHRALFCLPPIQPSASTDVAVPELPAQKVVTGDTEVDAVLWLREVISTGQADLIEKARAAATRIKTPLKEVEKRYIDYLRRTQPGNFGAVLMSFGFADIDGWISTSIERAAHRHEAQSRFGGDILKDTQAENFCINALKGLRQKKPHWDYDEKAVDKRFDKRVEEQPGTLTDCILELTFWSELYWLRNAVHQHSDSPPQAQARQDYVFRMLSRIPPRDPEEAAKVLRYLAGNDGMDRAQTSAVLMNLVGAPQPYHAHEAGGPDA